MRRYFVYILSSRSRRLYIGVTSNLVRRLAEHRERLGSGFTRRYGISTLVHVEIFADPARAIAREKQLKKWPRQRKDRLIARRNPEWRDLAVEWGWVVKEAGRAGDPDR